MTDNSHLTEKLLIEQQQRSDLADSALSDQQGSTVTDRAPVAVSLRMILLLSIACWGLIILAVAWLLR